MANIDTLLRDFNKRVSEQRRSTYASKRSNRNRSGRAGRKQYQSRRALHRAGGTLDLVRAIGYPADKPLCHIKQGPVAVWNGVVGRGGDLGGRGVR